MNEEAEENNEEEGESLFRQEAIENYSDSSMMDTLFVPIRYRKELAYLGITLAAIAFFLTLTIL